jgi:hypothetical protein
MNRRMFHGMAEIRATLGCKARVARVAGESALVVGGPMISWLRGDVLPATPVDWTNRLSLAHVTPLLDHADAPAPDVMCSITRWNSSVGEKSTYSESSSASGAWPGAQ